MNPNNAGGPMGQWPSQPPGGAYPPQNQNSNPYAPPQHAFEPPKKSRQFNILLVPLIVAVVFLLASMGFGVWAFMERNTYKNDTDQIVAREVELAKQETASEKDKEFVEKEKQPFKQYVSPSQSGSIEITYPKTWSAFVTEADRGNTPVDGYFHPSFVPGTKSGTAFALRIQVIEQPYDAELKRLDPKIKSNKVSVAPYRAKNVPDVLGAKVSGEINTGQKDTMVMFPLRDKTIKIWTESEQFLGDFENTVLPNLVFVP